MFGSVNNYTYICLKVIRNNKQILLIHPTNINRMRKSLLKTFLAAAGLAFGTTAFAAVGYVVTSDNSSDETKQDVTYTFNNTSTYPADGVLVGTEVGAYVYNGTDYTSVYTCTTEGLERLAFNAGAGTGLSAGQWWLRTESTSYGIQLRASRDGGETGAIAILDLEEGDQVVMSGSNLGGYFAFPGASSVDGTEQEAVSGDGEASYTVTGTTGNTITISVTSAGYVASYVTAYNYMYIQKIVITETKPDAEAPDGEITGVDGISRTIALTTSTSDASIYYTTDGSTPTSESTLYTGEITISETTTISAITVTSTATSDVYTKTFEAGVEISLADISGSITSLDKSGSSYYPTYSFTCDNSSVLLAPTATLTATYDGEEVSDFEGTFEFYGTGTLVVTASADGYASTTTTIEGATYSLKSTSTDLSNVSGDDVELGLIGDGWTIDGSSTRWGSWSKTNGVDTDLEANGGAEYYTATNTSTSITLDDFVTFEDAGGVVLLFGYGIGSNNRTHYASISVETSEGDVAEYAYCGYGTTTGKQFVQYSETNTTLQYAQERYYVVSQVKYYTQNANSTNGIENVSTKSQEIEGAFYNLQGVKVQNPQKGLYIQNGKKVIIK